MFDLVGALAGLAAFAPAMAVIAVAVLIDDGRPVIFRQKRLARMTTPCPWIASTPKNGARRSTVNSLRGPSLSMPSARHGLALAAVSLPDPPKRREVGALTDTMSRLDDLPTEPDGS